jgi:Leucine-rich repeat (LRR) protein
MYQMEVHPQMRPDLTHDLNTEDVSTTVLFINGKTKNIQRLKSFTKLQKLWVYNTNQEQFNTIMTLVNPKMLQMVQMRVEDLTLLGSLSNIEILALDWNTKAKKLWEMTNNRALKSLSIKDFPKLDDNSLMQTCPKHLESLVLSSGEWNKLKISTLHSLEHLMNLNYVSLIGVHVKDESLKPISHLNGLKKLDISTNTFPTEEYARLSVALRKTECAAFQPYIHFSPPIGDKDVLVVGKRKPFLNSKADVKRLQKYEDEYKVFQEKYNER